MRFHFGAVPTSPDFAPDASWKPVREPRPWLIQFIALPIGIVTAALMAVLWLTITPLRLATFTLTPVSFLISAIGIAVVHEIAHAVVHPEEPFEGLDVVGYNTASLLVSDSDLIGESVSGLQLTSRPTKHISRVSGSVQPQWRPRTCLNRTGRTRFLCEGEL